MKTIMWMLIAGFPDEMWMLQQPKEEIVDVTNTGNGERGTGNGERESGNECTAVTRQNIQNGGRRKQRGNN